MFGHKDIVFPSSDLQIRIFFQQICFHNCDYEAYLTFICNIKTCPPVCQATDHMEEMNKPGIVFRLSSLTITKALIRLDSSPHAGSDGSLGLFAVVIDTREVCGLCFGMSVIASERLQKAS